jgi:hypothetical protein
MKIRENVQGSDGKSKADTLRIMGVFVKPKASS